MSMFRSCDKDGNGVLTWNNGEIRTFMRKLFESKGWPAPPSETGMYSLFLQFDADHSNSLDCTECCHMARSYIGLVINAVEDATPRAYTPPRDIVGATVIGQKKFVYPSRQIVVDDHLKDFQWAKPVYTIYKAPMLDWVNSPMFSQDLFAA